MRNLLTGVTSLLLITIAFTSSAQKPNIKFGEIKPRDFETKVYSIDSNANAVVLSDVASTKYQGDKNGFKVLFQRHLRMRILDRKAFDAATISIPLYTTPHYEEKIENLEANTYNIENGTVEVTKLDKASIFKDKLSKYYTVRKFTMPNLKEGCIIEIKYLLSSPYERELRPWNFQGEYPVLWSEYKASVPSVYDFVNFQQGYHPFSVKTSTRSQENFSLLLTGESANERNQMVTFSADVITSTWAMANVPALKKENFTTTLFNHISRIEFQLSKIRYPETPVKDVMSNWYTVSEELMKDPNFGETITKNNHWLHDELKTLLSGSKDKLDVARRIFQYVRDNFTCTSHNRYYLTNTLKKTFQSKSGTVADINLLLTAMLIQQGFTAHPVLLSTRDNGKAYELYPIMDKLNYVISKVEIDGVSYLLDASHSKLGFGKLNTDCYNGFARIIDVQNPLVINLSADSLKEQKITSVMLFNDDKAGLTGSFTSTLGQQQSYDLREKLVKVNKDDFFKDIKKGYSFDINLSNSTFDSLQVYEQPVTIKYDLKFDASEDIIYLNPIFTEAQNENPFKAAERKYPVEMPYSVNETYVLRMDVPKGYKVEELPKSTRVKFNDNEGMFEYLITNQDGIIQLRSKVQLNRATFDPEDYQSLRDFFSHIVKKHSEQIVLKKIKA